MVLVVEQTREFLILLSNFADHFEVQLNISSEALMSPLFLRNIENDAIRSEKKTKIQSKSIGAETEAS